ncbi:ABC transporter permease [Luedemannella helvata]|uniref:ABC transporter permease n=1 Tax=Luedemannella helvata TaxID=349315 RepID=A0ABP4VWI5_9ACTN
MSVAPVTPAVPALAGARSAARRPRHDWLKQLLVITGLLVVWEVVVRVYDVDPLILPPPSSIAENSVSLIADGTLIEAAANTFWILLQSIVVGSAIAVGLAAFGVFSNFGGLFLRTISSIMNPLPGVALLPLVMVWLGFGTKAIIAVILNTVVWVVALNLYTGFQATPLTLRRVGRSMQLSHFRMLKDIYLPSAVPSALTAMRMAWAYGWRTVISVELILGATAGQSGLGSFIFSARYNYQVEDLFSGLIAIIILGLLIEQTIRAVERRTAVRWGLLENNT